MMGGSCEESHFSVFTIKKKIKSLIINNNKKLRANTHLKRYICFSFNFNVYYVDKSFLVCSLLNLFPNLLCTKCYNIRPAV